MKKDKRSSCLGPFKTMIYSGMALMLFGGFATQSYAQVTNVQAVAAGEKHTVALKDDGTVAAWGRNDDGQCEVPAGLTGVQSVAAGGRHTVALKNDGTVTAWGWNIYGQCDVPEGLSGVQSIAAGGRHTVALKDDGTVVAWGWNNYGQCEVPAGLTGVQSAFRRAGCCCGILPHRGAERRRDGSRLGK